MTRMTLLLIMVCIVFTSQLSFGLGDVEESDERKGEAMQKTTTTKVKATDDLVSIHPSETQSKVLSQYLLGVTEYNQGNVELAKIWFQQAWESLESEEGKATTKKTQFFESGLNRPSAIFSSATPDAASKVQFPTGYKVDVYYRDGWYLQPKDSSIEEKQVRSFLPGSTYKVRLEAEEEHPARKKINIGMKVIASLIIISWVIAR